jgi:hypothetical protein
MMLRESEFPKRIGIGISPANGSTLLTITLNILDILNFLNIVFIIFVFVMFGMNGSATLTTGGSTTAL